MNARIACLLPVLFAASGEPLSTDYAKERTLRIESEFAFEAEVTDFEMLRDGEPVEAGFDRSGLSSSGTRRIVQLDRVLEHDDGQPLAVRRTFEELRSDGTSEFQGETTELGRDGSLAGVTLELRADEDGDVDVSVVDGTEPDDAAFEGQQLALALDALLPMDEEEDLWDLENDAIVEGLGFDLETALFPRQDDEEGDDRRGRRGTPLARMMAGLEWEGEARLTSESVDHEGVDCVRIEIEISGEGELGADAPGGGRRERAPAAPAGAAQGGNTVQVGLEGTFFFSRVEGRPVALDLEGTVEMERRTERSRGDRTMEIRVAQEGTVEISVLVTEE